MRCGHCGSPLPDGSLFCTNCGTDVAGAASNPSAPLDDAGVARLTRLLREETAGEYEIERELARGGMGVVYLATETQLRRRVAIKVLPPTLTFGEGAIERFRREARTAAGLDHPYIIPIYRVSAGGDLLWYSMKLLEGKTLDAVLKERERLEFEEVIAVLGQVADALDYAHRHGVVHRDVKPGNIMLDEGGRVTVTDFGIAKELQETSASGSGHLLGTPFYMSPEHFLGGVISGAADQYSLAVVAYRCLSGQVPFDASTAYELLNKHVTQEPPPLVELRSGLPVHAYAAIERALAKLPEDRFATATDFVNALAGRAPTVPATRRTRRRHAFVTWGAGVAVVAVAAYAVISLRAPAHRAAQPPLPAPVNEATPGPGGIAAPATSRASARPPRPAPRQAPSAVLILRVSPGWASIYVDGGARGERPVHREELPPGTHTLRFERPGFVSIDTTLTLRSGTNVIEIALRRVEP